jgi:putative glutamine amidotransferase
MTDVGITCQRPVVGLSACAVELDGVPNQVCRSNYTRSVRQAGCLPVILPAIEPAIAGPELVDILDGLLLTGSVSNVGPARYEQPRDNSKAYDEARDATIFPLIHAAIQAGIPIFAICRGLHELNVALGGSLFQNVHDVDGKMDHREDESQPRSIQYAPVHRVRLTADGVLNHVLGCQELKVSSLHWQGIDKLGRGLAIEAVADDGLIEAVSLCNAGGSVFGVQWHPEWFADDADGLMLFQYFAAACNRRRRDRHAGRSKANPRKPRTPRPARVGERSV